MLPSLTADCFAFKSEFLKCGFVDFHSQNPIGEREDIVGPRSTFRKHDNISSFDVGIEEVARDDFNELHVHASVAQDAITRGELVVQGLLGF